jgi:hypothetical protein
MNTNKHRMNESQVKFEARNSKFGTNSNDPNIKIQNHDLWSGFDCFCRKASCGEHSKIRISILFLISRLGFRIFSPVAVSFLSEAVSGLKAAAQ